MDAVNDFLPSPLDIGSINGHDPDDSDVAMKREPSVDDSFSALAFKVMTDPYVGKLTFMRVYSGSLNAGSYVANPNTGKRERISRILLMVEEYAYWTYALRRKKGDSVRINGIPRTCC